MGEKDDAFKYYINGEEIGAACDFTCDLEMTDEIRTFLDELVKDIPVQKPSNYAGGSKIKLGEEEPTVSILVKSRFNFVQKKMIKWCFGFTVEDVE